MATEMLTEFIVRCRPFPHRPLNGDEFVDRMSDLIEKGYFGDISLPGIGWTHGVMEFSFFDKAVTDLPEVLGTNAVLRARELRMRLVADLIQLCGGNAASIAGRIELCVMDLEKLRTEDDPAGA